MPYSHPSSQIEKEETTIFQVSIIILFYLFLFLSFSNKQGDYPAILSSGFYAATLHRLCMKYHHMAIHIKTSSTVY